jgi:hypothetical protein
MKALCSAQRNTTPRPSFQERNSRVVARRLTNSAVNRTLEKKVFSRCLKLSFFRQ